MVVNREDRGWAGILSAPVQARYRPSPQLLESVGKKGYLSQKKKVGKKGNLSQKISRKREIGWASQLESILGSSLVQHNK